MGLILLDTRPKLDSKTNRSLFHGCTTSNACFWCDVHFLQVLVGACIKIEIQIFKAEFYTNTLRL